MALPDYTDETNYWDQVAQRSASSYAPTAKTASNVTQLGTNYPWMSPGVTMAAASTDQDGRELARAELANILSKSSYMPGEQVVARQPHVDQATRRLTRYRNLLDDYLANKEKVDAAIKLWDTHEGRMTPEVDKAGQIKSRYFDALHVLGDTPESLANLDRVLQAGPRSITKADKLIRDAVAGLAPKGTSDLEAITDVAGAGLGGAAFVAGQISKLGDVKLPGQQFTSREASGGLAQGAALVMQTGYQAASALNRVGARYTDFRSGNEGNPLDIPRQVAEQTDVYQALKGKSLGSGILPSPESEAGQAAVQAAIRYSPTTYGGQAWTPGRSIADLVSTPGSDAFNVLSGGVDAALAITMDPANIALTRLAEARAAGKTFITPTAEALADRGAINGLSKATVGMRPSWWLTDEAAPFVKGATEETSPYHIWLATERKINNPTLLRDLANESDSQKVANLLMEKSGTDIENPIKAWEVKPGMRAGAYTPKGWSAPLGGDANLMQNVVEGERQLVNARVPFGVRGPVMDTWFRATTPAARAEAMKATSDAITSQLIENGVANVPDKEIAALVAKRYPGGIPAGQTDKGVWITAQKELQHGRLDALTEMFHNDKQALTVYNIDAVTGQDALNPLRVNVDGSWEEGPSPHLIAEMLSGPIEWPDYHLVRRATSPYSAAVDNKVWAHAAAGGDALMRFWKPAVILRPALTLRIIGDEQLRLAAEGLPNAFTHPIQLIAQMIGQRNAGDVLGTAFNQAENSGLRTAMGQNRFDPGENKVLQEALGSGGLKLDTKKELSFWIKVNMGHEKAPEGVIANAVKMGRDPLLPRTFEMTPDEMMDWLRTGDGKPYVDSLHGQYPLIDNPDKLRDYVNSLYDRVDNWSQANPEMLDMLRTQKVPGTDTPIWDVQKGQANPAALAFADRMRNEGRIGNWTTLPVSVFEPKARKGVWDKTTGFFFDHLLTSPSDQFSRGPAYESVYWNKVEQSFPELSADARKQVIGNLDKSFVAKDQAARIRNLDKTLSEHGLEGDLTAADINVLANHAGITKTQALLYDLSNKSQWSDAARLIAPFGEAWREVMTTWFNLVKDHPNILRRAEQAAIAARDAQIDPITGLPHAGGVGFFHMDPQTGQQVFTYPGSGLLTDKLLGVPIPMHGSAQGLSLIGQGLPGVGPAVSIPAAWFLPNKPSLDQVKQLIFPYGLPTGTSPVDTITGTVVPGWLKNINQAFSEPNGSQQYANVTLDIAKYDASTGEFDLRGDDPAGEMRRLLDKAKSQARWFYVIRGFAQATGPTAPSPDFLVKDKSGHLLLTALVAQDYRKKADKVGYDAAFQWLLDRYGPDNFFLPQSKSQVNAAGLATGDTGQYDWVRTHEHLREQFPQVWALFAPQSGKFDYEAYQAEFKRGDREGIAPQKMVENANSRLASYIYFQTRDKFGAVPDNQKSSTQKQQEATYLSQLRTDLIAQFPGYNPDIPTGAGKTRQLVTQLEDALLNPQLAGTPVGKAVSRYLEERQWAIDDAKKAGFAGPWQAAKAAPLRDYLREYAADLIHQYPGFSAVWDSVFQREFKDDLGGHMTLAPTTTAAKAPVSSPSPQRSQDAQPRPVLGATAAIDDKPLTVPSYAKRGPYQTHLSDTDEAAFRQWVTANHVPFDPNQKNPDYDMRGFYKAMQAGDPRATRQMNDATGTLHFPDTWKTPYHKTFSNESIYAKRGAPHWVGTKLVAKDGKVLFDESK